MEKRTQETERILNERFNRDNIIALATVQDGTPYVRNVNGFYEDGSFYVITYALSNKMKQIEKIHMWRLAAIGLQHTERE